MSQPQRKTPLEILAEKKKLLRFIRAEGEMIKTHKFHEAHPNHVRHHAQHLDELHHHEDWTY